MAKRLDRVLVIDVESTCWDGYPPPGETSEIIEVGICTLEVATLQRFDRRSILVRPQKSNVSEFCTRLTSISSDMLRDGVTLAEAVQVLKDEYDSESRLWASWGDYDRGQFQRNCRDYDIGYPFGPTHLNIKNLFAVALGWPRELGIDQALEKLGLPFEGTHHRGGDDAWNIANLLSILLRRVRRV